MQHTVTLHLTAEYDDLGLGAEEWDESGEENGAVGEEELEEDEDGEGEGAAR